MIIGETVQIVFETMANLSGCAIGRGFDQSQYVLADPLSQNYGILSVMLQLLSIRNTTNQIKITKFPAWCLSNAISIIWVAN